MSDTISTFRNGDLLEVMTTAMKFMAKPNPLFSDSVLQNMWLNFDGEFLHVHSTNEGTFFTHRLWTLSHKAPAWPTPILLAHMDVLDFVNLLKRKGKKDHVELAVTEDVRYLNVDLCSLPLLQTRRDEFVANSVIESYEGLHFNVIDDPYYYDSKITCRGLPLCSLKTYKQFLEIIKAFSGLPDVSVRRGRMRLGDSSKKPSIFEKPGHVSDLPYWDFSAADSFNARRIIWMALKSDPEGPPKKEIDTSWMSEPKMQRTK